MYLSLTLAAWCRTKISKISASHSPLQGFPILPGGNGRVTAFYLVPILSLQQSCKCNPPLDETEISPNRGGSPSVGISRLSLSGKNIIE